jgi:putative hydrolase of the HAD superfamily
VLAALDLSDCFDGLWDIHAMNTSPSPSHRPIAASRRSASIPRAAVFVEDSAATSPRPRRWACRPFWLDFGTEWGAPPMDRRDRRVIDDFPKMARRACRDGGGQAAL